ncbi:MAG: PLDc_N domain-containing protein [Candidatus Heimdallarchaeota archaeon]|nr:PLDc_N domain-containing protein [Candidatus Heimdallarchaeota archaeon]
MDVAVLLAIVIPIAIVDLAIRGFAIYDMSKTFDKRSNANKIAWILAIALVNAFGWILYFLFGRLPVEKTDNEESWD